MIRGCRRRLRKTQGSLRMCEARPTSPLRAPQVTIAVNKPAGISSRNSGAKVKAVDRGHAVPSSGATRDQHCGLDIPSSNVR